MSEYNWMLFTNVLLYNSILYIYYVHTICVCINYILLLRTLAQATNWNSASNSLCVHGLITLRNTIITLPKPKTAGMQDHVISYVQWKCLVNV